MTILISIQDIEALCLRVSILCDGKFITIGTFEDLKDMYGNFILSIKVNPNQEDLLEEKKFIIYIIMETFPDIIYKETSLEVYLIDFCSNISKLFFNSLRH